jgi:hypothetical protein
MSSGASFGRGHFGLAVAVSGVVLPLTLAVVSAVTGSQGLGFVAWVTALVLGAAATSLGLAAVRAACGRTALVLGLAVLAGAGLVILAVA